MYSVLIVDDEPLIREGLKTIIDWGAYGFVVADTASDGPDALSKLQQLEPQLIIVDIRMPGMDGLAFIEEAQRGLKSACRFLILSGYADFEYARRALQMKTDGYMLKPVDEDELIAYLKELRPRLDLEAESRRREDKPVSELSKERMLIRLLTREGGPLSEESVKEAGLGPGRCQVILIQTHGPEEKSAASSSAVKLKLAEWADRSGQATVFFSDPYLGIALSGLSDSSHAARALIREIADECNRMAIEFTAVAGRMAAGPEVLHESYQDALIRMKRRFFYEPNQLHNGGDAEEQPILQELLTASGTLDSGAGIEAEQAYALDISDAEGRLLLILELGNGEAAEALLREAGRIMQLNGLTEEEIKGAYALIFTTVIGRLTDSHPELRTQAPRFQAELSALYRSYKFSTLIEGLIQLASKIAAELRTTGGDKPVERMIAHIQQHYRDNLKLESLAEAFNYNSSYLGKLFKNATGEYFNTYLDKIRIERAKGLLEQGMKVYQVAEQVGYSNVDYFHGKFRKYVGSSPSAYRKR